MLVNNAIGVSGALSNNITMSPCNIASDIAVKSEILPPLKRVSLISTESAIEKIGTTAPRLIPSPLRTATSNPDVIPISIISSFDVITCTKRASVPFVTDASNTPPFLNSTVHPAHIFNPPCISPWL